MQMQMQLSRIPWDVSEVLHSQKMDKVTVQATMTKAETPCVPQGEQSIISLAAQFFAPDYAPKIVDRGVVTGARKRT